MAYRTYINDHEWLGNNEYSEIIFDELKRQGCPFDEEWDVGFKEPFEVKDLDGLVKAVERHLMHLYNTNPKQLSSLSIFANVENGDNRGYTENQLTLRLQEFSNYGYLFYSVNLLKYVGEEGKDWEFYWERDKESNELVCHYRLINDGKCLFKAY